MLSELVPLNPYCFNYNTAAKETRNQITHEFCPDLKSGNEPIEDFDIIFLGSPNWFKSYAPPLLTFLRSHDFSKKTIIPFCTHGGSGFGEIESNIKGQCLVSKILPGLSINSKSSPEQIIEWLNKIGL